MLRSSLLGLILLLAAAFAAAPASAAPLVDIGGGDDTFWQGQWAVELSGAYTHPIRFSEDKFYQANLGFHYYFGEAVSLGTEFAGYFVDQPREDTVLASAGLLLRWHFLRAERCTLFVDGGIGVSLAEAEVPEFGTHFNYTPKGGGGTTIELREGVHLIGGVRFFHLSNGNLYGRDENPSQDGVQYYVGVLFTM